MAKCECGEKAEYTWWRTPFTSDGVMEPVCKVCGKGPPMINKSLLYGEEQIKKEE